MKLKSFIDKLLGRKLVIQDTTTVNAVNSIFSPNVSFAALQGHSIEIRENSIVDALSRIGSYTYIGYHTFITKATIGRYCSIAPNVSIGLGEHDVNKISTSASFYDDPMLELTRQHCTIGNDVWIGVDSIIKRGVQIGDGAVIGANSFVNKDVPAFAVVGGVPAKFIKYRFDAEKISRIQQSKWWELDLEEARLIVKNLEADN